MPQRLLLLNHLCYFTDLLYSENVQFWGSKEWLQCTEWYYLWKWPCIPLTSRGWSDDVAFFSPPPLRDNADDFKVQTAKHPNIGSAPLRPHSEQSKDRASKRLSSESNGTSEGGVGSSTPVELTALEESFRRFAIHGDTRATGKEMHGKNWSKLCKDCGVIDGKSITLTDVDIVFSKVK